MLTLTQMALSQPVYSSWDEEWHTRHGDIRWRLLWLRSTPPTQVNTGSVALAPSANSFEATQDALPRRVLQGFKAAVRPKLDGDGDAEQIFNPDVLI